MTGASEGIGKAIAMQLLHCGARVIVSARNTERLSQVFGSQNGIFILPLDYEQSAGFPEKVKQALEWTGSVDVLINNGGVSQRSQALETDEAIMRRIMEINYWGHVLLAKELLLQTRQEKWPLYIVEMSSVAGVFGYFLRSSYSAAKHAVKGFFESLALELHPDVKVLLVYPGKIATDIARKVLEGDGTMHGKRDLSHEAGYPVEKTANKILSALARNKQSVYIGGRELKAVWLKKWWPSLLFRIFLKNPEM